MSAAATTTTSTTASSNPITMRKATGQKQQQQQKALPGIGVELLTAGSAACVADLFTFPLDTAKVRLQVRIEEDDNQYRVEPQDLTPEMERN